MFATDPYTTPPVLSLHLYVRIVVLVTAILRICSRRRFHCATESPDFKSNAPYFSLLDRPIADGGDVNKEVVKAIE